MFSKLSEQVKNTSQPASDLFAANVKALQTVSQQQSTLLSGMLEDSMKLFQSVSKQTEFTGLVAAQTVYAESVRERLTVTSKQAFSTLTEVNEKLVETMKTSLSNTQATPTTVSDDGKSTKTPVKKSATKKAVSKKTPAVKKTVTKAAPQVKTKAAAKPTQNAAPKAVSKTTSKTSAKTDAKPVAVNAENTPVVKIADKATIKPTASVVAKPQSDTKTVVKKAVTSAEKDAAPKSNAANKK